MAKRKQPKPPEGSPDGPRPLPPEANPGVSAARPHALQKDWAAFWGRVEPGLFGFDRERRAEVELAAGKAWWLARGRRLMAKLTRPGRRGPDAEADKVLLRELMAGQGLRRIAKAVFPGEWSEAGREKLRRRLLRWRKG